MEIRAARKAALLLILVPFFSACGDMDTLFPSGNSYRVRANVNGASLEDDSSIIRSGDRVSPYFAVPVENDPDVTGLWVYLRNQNGEIAGHGIRFVLGVPDDETSQGPADEGEADAVVEIAVRSFGQELPSFSLPGGMAIGPHTLVFEVLGGRTTLRRTEIPVFYIGDAEFALRDISMSLPGLFASRLVPPGTKVLLEARLDFDARLDPYLVWHGGRNVIHAGRLREGAGSVLWEAPNQAAFHPLRLEILPYPPLGPRRNFPGVSREIMLPVSANADTVGFFFGTGLGHPALNRLAEGLFHLERIHDEPSEENDGDVENAPEPPELLNWYRFEGRLRDATAAMDEERFLAPVGEHVPRWASMGHSYGLSTCDDHAFLLPPVNFFRYGSDHGGGVFLSHIRPVAEGTIFSAYFPAHSPAGGAWLDLSRKGDAIVMRVGTPETTIEVPVFLALSELRSLIPVAVKFYIHPDRMEANLGLGENAFLQSAVQDVRLSEALTGKGVIRLGGEPLDSWSHAPARVVIDFADPPYAPWDEPVGTTTVPDVDKDFPDSYWEELEEGAGVPPDFQADFPTWYEAEDPHLVDMGMETEPIGPAVTTIWNEFAVLLSFAPFPRPVIVAEEDPENEEYVAGEETTAGARDDDPAEAPVIASPETETLEPGMGATLDEDIDADAGVETLA